MIYGELLKNKIKPVAETKGKSENADETEHATSFEKSEFFLTSFLHS